MRCTSARRLVTNSPDRKFCTPVAASGIEHSTSVHVKIIRRFFVMTSVPMSQKNITAFRKCSVSSVTLPPGQYDSGMVRIDQVTRATQMRSEEHTSELQSQSNLVCRLLLENHKNSALSRR